MVNYLQLCLLFSCRVCQQGQQEPKLFNDLPSDDLKIKFDSFPLVSRTVQEIDWCKVSQ